jgi:hypothetical protein
MAPSYVAVAMVVELLASGGAGAVSASSPAGPTYGTPQKAADAALAQLAALGPDAGVEGVGTTTPGGLRAGAPIPEANVRLDELAAFTPAADPSRLLHSTGAYLVPALSGGAAVAAVTVVRSGKGYSVAAVGDAPLAQAVSAQLARRRAGAARLVRIPALHLAFLGEGAGRGLVLVPLSTDAGLRLEAGKAERATAVFQRLAPVARAAPKDTPG